MSTTSSGLSRRTIVKGAAWSVPVVAVAGAAPAFAASPIPPRGLNGWVTLRRNCWDDYEFRIDGRGNFTGGGTSDRGIWTFVEGPADITFAEIIFYFNRGNLSFNNDSGTGWSNLERRTDLDSGSPANGYYAYVANYTGTWTQYPNHDAWVADGDPHWRHRDLSTCSNGVCGYARRTITVNGETITFQRGPVCV